MTNSFLTTISLAFIVIGALILLAAFIGYGIRVTSKKVGFNEKTRTLIILGSTILFVSLILYLVSK